MALGTLFGGWRIVRTMGSKITRLTPDAGLLRRDRRSGYVVSGDLARDSGVDHAHDYRGDRRRGRCAADIRSALERGRQYSLCLDRDHAGSCACCCLVLRSCSNGRVSAIRVAPKHTVGQQSCCDHSDRGSQYTSEAFQRLMAEHGVTCSLSGSGNVWDNAESFFSP